MHVLTLLLGTIVNTLLIAVVVRRLLGVAVGWPRTLLLSVIATTTAGPPLERIFGWVGLGSTEAATSAPGPASLIGLLYIAWVLALEVSVLAVAEAVVPTGTLPGPVELVRGLPGWLRRTRRYLAILRIAAQRGLLRYLGRSRPLVPGGPRRRRDTATSLREALTQGGVTFVKLGQMLATRPDLLPPRYVEELSQLHSQVPAEPWPVVERMLTEELGEEPATAFASIDTEPLAAASVGQVHAATLRTGEEVVVKVQRSNARDLVRDDLDIVTRLAALTERRTTWARRLGTSDLAAGFRRSLHEELDYRVELHSLTTLRSSDTVVIPRAHPTRSTRRTRRSRPSRPRRAGSSRRRCSTWCSSRSSSTASSTPTCTAVTCCSSPTGASPCSTSAPSDGWSAARAPRWCRCCWRSSARTARRRPSGSRV